MSDQPAAIAAILTSILELPPNVPFSAVRISRVITDGSPPLTNVYWESTNAGQLLPLNTFTKQMGWEDNIAPWALKLGVVDGDLYSLPVEQETIILYYNKTLFEEKGWKPPVTMDELMALAQEISDEGIIPLPGKIPVPKRVPVGVPGLKKPPSLGGNSIITH